MPRLRVIILEQSSNDYGYAFWADVPTARQVFYANSSAKSVWTGATIADNDALKSGAVVESVSTQRVPQGTTLAQAEAFLQNRWQTFQDFITNDNRWLHYGSNWDGTTWTIVTST